MNSIIYITVACDVLQICDVPAHSSGDHLLFGARIMPTPCHGQGCLYLRIVIDLTGYGHSREISLHHQPP